MVSKFIKHNVGLSRIMDSGICSRNIFAKKGVWIEYYNVNFIAKFPKKYGFFLNSVWQQDWHTWAENCTVQFKLNVIITCLINTFGIIYSRATVNGHGRGEKSSDPKMFELWRNQPDYLGIHSRLASHRNLKG